MVKQEMVELHMEEIEAMDAPDANSQWMGVLSGIGVVGAIAIIAT